MDIDPQPLGMEPAWVAHTLQSVERVERRLGVQHFTPLGIDRAAPGLEQVVDIALGDALPGEIDLDRGDVRIEAARREADPHLLDIGTCDALRLLDRLADRMFGALHVGDETVLDAAALALAGAEHLQSALGRLGDQRGHFRRSDIDRRDQSFRSPLRHRLPLTHYATAPGAGAGAGSSIFAPGSGVVRTTIEPGLRMSKRTKPRPSRRSSRSLVANMA